MYKNQAITDVEVVKNSIEIRTTSKNVVLKKIQSS